MQQPGRLRLRPWLEEQIQSGRYPGVSWLDQSAQIFQIPWKHAARHGWSIDQDATLFRSWAIHTGRYRPGKDKPDPKTWKANFRCALNSLPDICELQEHSRKRGNNAYRVYRMLPSTHAHRRRRGLRLFSRPQDKQSSRGDERVDSYLAHTWQPCTPPPVSVVPHRVETPAEDTFGIYQTHGMWEAKPEEPEQNDAVFKLMNHADDAEHWTQTGEQRGWRRQTLWDQWQSTTLCAADDNAYFLHADNDLFGPNCIKELSEWTSCCPSASVRLLTERRAEYVALSGSGVALHSAERAEHRILFQAKLRRCHHQTGFTTVQLLRRIVQTPSSHNSFG